MILLTALLLSLSARAQSATYELSLVDAETRSLKSSNDLRSYLSTSDAAVEQADAQFSALLPRLSLDGNYHYVTKVPTISVPIPGLGVIPFGSSNTYSVGPTLSYTLWDTMAARKSYYSLSKLAEARSENFRNAQLQLLLNLRAAYVRVQLALEEMRLTNDSLKLSRAQNHDITANYRAGAATRLDLVDSQREVLSYELQFQQRQADLSSALKDLVAYTGEAPGDLSHPGPPDVENVTLVLKLDSLEAALKDAAGWKITPPTDSHPELRVQELTAESSELAASSTKAALFPTVQVSARASLDYPYGPYLVSVEQNTFAVTLSMPLFETDHTRHLAAEKLKEAESARFHEEQLKIDLSRDFGKASEMLASLRAQQKIASDDVERSEDAARLYYASYKGGHVNLIDVQSANNRALQAKVEATRIDAQVLNQLITLKALSGEESHHGR